MESQMQISHKIKVQNSIDISALTHKTIFLSGK